MVRTIFGSGLYSCQNSIKYNVFVNGIVFEAELYSNQASDSKFTVFVFRRFDDYLRIGKYSNLGKSHQIRAFWG